MIHLPGSAYSIGLLVRRFASVVVRVHVSQRAPRSYENAFRANASSDRHLRCDLHIQSIQDVSCSEAFIINTV
jgi:hypothetical protein